MARWRRRTPLRVGLAYRRPRSCTGCTAIRSMLGACDRSPEFFHGLVLLDDPLSTIASTALDRPPLRICTDEIAVLPRGSDWPRPCSKTLILLLRFGRFLSDSFGILKRLACRCQALLISCLLFARPYPWRRMGLGRSTPSKTRRLNLRLRGRRLLVSKLSAARKTLHHRVNDRVQLSFYSWAKQAANTSDARVVSQFDTNQPETLPTPTAISSTFPDRPDFFPTSELLKFRQTHLTVRPHIGVRV